MLSLIICSRNSDISATLKKNIETTIGINYELIVINNSLNHYSIFEAYNQGIRKSKYQFLCFMHEDILYHTHNWGNKVINHFNKPSIGIIGIAGGHFLPNGPSSWPSPLFNSINILQTFSENGKTKIVHVKEFKHFKGNTAEVVAIDGVWFCLNKGLIPNVRFDDNTFNGFHCYDIDICLQAREKGYKVIVVSDILIEHFSGGDWGNEWIENTNRLLIKWKGKFPQTAGVRISQKEIELIEAYKYEIFKYLQEINELKKEIKRIKSTKAYLIGKKIIRPFYMIRKLLK